MKETQDYNQKLMDDKTRQTLDAMKNQNRNLKSGPFNTGAKDQSHATLPLSPSNLPNHIVFNRFAMNYNSNLDGHAMTEAEKAMNREYISHE